MNWVKVICVWQLGVIFHQYVADLRDEGSGSADLLASAMRDSQTGVGDCVPQPTYQTVKPETVLLPLPPDAEQQCRQLQEFRTCRTSESRQPPLLCSLSAISSTRTLPWNTPEFYRLRLRLTVFSLSAESRCVHQVRPGYHRRRMSPCFQLQSIPTESTVVICFQGRSTLLLCRRAGAHQLLQFRQRW